MAVNARVSGLQLALGVRLRDDARFENFHGERNAGAAERLVSLCTATDRFVAVVCGDEDTGKSHLLQACCRRAEELGRTSVCMSIEELLRFGPEALDGLDSPSLVALDDLELIAGNPGWEEAVFHLYNRVTDQGHSLLISLKDLPGALTFELEDLVSRLRHGLVIQLGIYRDDDRMTILRSRAEQRGLVMSDEVAVFILRRAPRQLAELLSILDRLDENSLRAQRKLTIPFVKSVMAW